MKTWRKSLLACLGSFVTLTVAASTAAAQVINSPDYKPAKNTGGWVYQFAILLGLLASVTVILLVISYMMRAPRFARQEEGLKVVRADRVHPGKDLPRRAVDVSQAVQMVVAPPAVPSSVPAAVAVSVAPPSAAPAPAPVPAAAPAAAPSAPAAAPSPAAPAAPAPSAERHEVPLDQATFDKTLEELLAKGTDRRVAEGKARRAAMIAARKKAAEG
ncbi:MAG: hypothetical protein HY240_04615 [Actinobacteria bacterium]|nr:hypothetical protein [Actinomycetota bacterium]